MELQRTHRARKEHPMLSKEKQMDVLEAYDVTKSLRAAAQLSCIDHHTVARLKASYRHANPRIYKPWIPEPGLWLQYDFGDGPIVEGTKTVLFCAWLAWSRFRVVLPLTDRTMGSVVAALDRTFRLIGGASTYVLTDNEKTVTERHIAGIAVRNESMVATANYYGVTICTCVPYDPESKGGSPRSSFIVGPKTGGKRMIRRSLRATSS
jgi:hypothetical protein